MSLKLSEDFYSIQGEGASVGVPAYFVRLTDCNLSCGFSQKMLNKIRKNEIEAPLNSQFHGDLHLAGEATWSCDSVPVWIRGREVPYQYLIDRWKEQGIYNEVCSGLIHIIWTGGEPTLKYHQESIIAFTQYWFSVEDKIIITPYYEVETNGTIELLPDFFDLLSQVNCSAKLSNSGMTAKKRIVPAALKSIMEHPNYWFKFVISVEEDIIEFMKDYVEEFDIPLQKVICMPGLDDVDDFHERTNFVCELAKKYKFIASQRLHISSWGQTTGV